MQMNRLMALLKKDLRQTIREPALVFLLILFPVLLTVTFGVAFGGLDTGGTTSFEIGIVNLDTTADNDYWSGYFIGNLSAVNGTQLHFYDVNATGQLDLLNGALDALVIIPAGFGNSIESYWDSPLDEGAWSNTTLAIYVDSGSMIASSAIPPLIQQALITTFYGENAGTLVLPVSVNRPALITVSDLSTWDYMAPGLFAFAAIFMIMTVSQSMTVARDEGLLSRLATTPMTSTEYMVSKTISNMILGIFQVGIIFAASYAIGYRPATSLDGLLFAFLIVSVFVLTCVGFGLITAVLSKSASVATGIAFIFIMPQMFFGTFMPLGSVTEIIGTFMPSSYVTHALTTLFLRGAPLTTVSLWFDFIIVLLVSVVVLLVGIGLFNRQIRQN